MDMEIEERNGHTCRRGLFIVCLPIVAAALLSTCSAHPQQATGNTSLAVHSQDRSLRRSWQFGGFFAGGLVPFYKVHPGPLSRTVELDLLSAGFEGGRLLTAFHGPNLLRGRGETVVEVMPFWLANYPSQTQTYCVTGEGCGHTYWGPYRRYGVSVTPLLLRWNFMKSETSRAVPWAQLGGGLLWTNHKFPLLGGSTSVINFTPQVGIGESVFIGKNRSLDFALKAVHISNAGLGDNDPGINVSLQFSIGYSWWR